MKAMLALFLGTAVLLLAVPLSVLLWRGLPLGNAETLPLEQEPALILPGDKKPPDEPKARKPKGLSSFRVLDTGTGRVMELSALDYVTGAIASEMPAVFGEEALIAQGVAAYTNGNFLAALRREQPEKELQGADFSVNTEKNEGYLTEKSMRTAWGGHYEEYYSRVRHAAEIAVRHLMLYEGEPILAAYFAIGAGGTTEDPSNVWCSPLPYLKPVENSWDKEAPGYLSTRTLTEEELRKLLTEAKAAPGKDPADWLEVLSRSDAGYVTSIRAGKRTLTGQEFRTLLGLRSSSFDFLWKKDRITFTVRGYGHGVGLSQCGANHLAELGKSFREILLHYYPGAELVEISP